MLLMVFKNITEKKLEKIFILGFFDKLFLGKTSIFEIFNSEMGTLVKKKDVFN